jgi:UDP-N-acetyl-D-galactosamine dehydrogenase
MIQKKTIVVIGLGYVGLPLAVRLSHHFTTIGYDINTQKLEELARGHDAMGEVSREELATSRLEYTADPARIREGDIIITAVPTPVDDHNVPDLTPVIRASETIGKHLKQGAIVVFESTVYPGVTEEVCAPIIERESGFTYNKDFFMGYSPERANPGDKEHTVDKIVKIVSGSTPEVTQRLKEVYGAVVTAGIHVAPSIRVAEAAKVIENVQRDINIALVNELAVLFDKLGINIHDVLAAAGTKWNFHRYTPGLVGGHCIGVDPYYLTYKAIEVGHHPGMILAGRQINDDMHEFYVQKLIRGLNSEGIAVNKAIILILGLTFKENCNDYRNSRTRHLIRSLKAYGPRIVAIDPWLDEETIRQFGAEPGRLADLKALKANAVIITVPHRQFDGIDLHGIKVIVDIKGRRSTPTTRLYNPVPLSNSNH